MNLYRRIAFGDLAEFTVLDTRQYRTVQPALEHRGDINNTLPGLTQERWLMDGLGKSRARWNVLAQQVFMAQRDFTAGPEQTFSMDAWDGYSASRDRILRFVEQKQMANLVVLSGDVHNNWVADLKADFNTPRSKTLGTEFVGTSISSTGDGSDTTTNGETVLSENPHIKFFNGQRGYVRCVLTPTEWRSYYQVVPFVQKPGAPLTTRASFLVENGRPGAVRLS
jgi:alkaline phosphatase D